MHALFYINNVYFKFIFLIFMQIKINLTAPLRRTPTLGLRWSVSLLAG